VARAPVQALAGVAYLATLLTLDHFASYPEQLALGASTWLVLAFALRHATSERRVQTVGVVAFATVGEVTGSLIWGVYHYRLHNLPLFVPPAHGLVYLTGLSVVASLERHARALVVAAATIAASWGLLGLTVLPRRDVAGAVGVPLLLLFLWRSRFRATYAAVFLVVAALELYGTAIGTWRWSRTLPGLGIPDGNPPSGVASGYVWFDVMALLVAPMILIALRSLSERNPYPASEGSP
jgi:FtsH-binding integral membrane protein